MQDPPPAERLEQALLQLLSLNSISPKCACAVGSARSDVVSSGQCPAVGNTERLLLGRTDNESSLLTGLQPSADPTPAGSSGRASSRSVCSVAVNPSARLSFKT